MFFTLLFTLHYRISSYSPSCWSGCISSWSLPLASLVWSWWVCYTESCCWRFGDNSRTVRPTKILWWNDPLNIWLLRGYPRRASRSRLTEARRRSDKSWIFTKKILNTFFDISFVLDKLDPTFFSKMIY